MTRFARGPVVKKERFEKSTPWKIMSMENNLQEEDSTVTQGQVNKKHSNKRKVTENGEHTEVKKPSHVDVTVEESTGKKKKSSRSKKILQSNTDTSPENLPLSVKKSVKNKKGRANDSSNVSLHTTQMSTEMPVADKSEVKKKKSSRSKKILLSNTDTSPVNLPLSAKKSVKKKKGRANDSSNVSLHTTQMSTDLPVADKSEVKKRKDALDTDSVPTIYTTKDKDEEALKREWKNIKRTEIRQANRVRIDGEKRVCFKCRKAGHELFNCPTADVTDKRMQCYKCGSIDHMTGRCKVKLPPAQFPFARCFICCEMGHIASRCPDNPRGVYPNGGCCKLCESVEHLAKDCPKHLKKLGIENKVLSKISLNKSVEADSDEETTPSPAKKGKKKLASF